MKVLLQVPGWGESGKVSVKVLLVEDDRFSQLVAEVALRNVGATFTSVQSGEEAMRLLEEQAESPFDFVLMDFRMPEMDGFDVTRKIRQHTNPSVRDVRVIGLSGSKTFADQREAMASGMNLCISKPVSAVMLKRVLFESSNAESGESSSSDPANSAKVLDARTLKYLADETDIQVVKKVVQSFLKNLPFYIDQISQGLAQERDELIHRYSHILKSSSGTVGATALFELASELEKISSEEHQESLFDLVSRTKAASKAVVSELTRYLEEVIVTEAVVNR